MIAGKYKNMLKISILFSILFIIIPNIGFSDYPEIKKLNNNDILYKQIQDVLKEYYKAISYGKEEQIPQLIIFKYRIKNQEDLFSISSRLNIPYDTISTLNRIENAKDFNVGDYILIPNLPGIFMPLNPYNALEEIMCSWRNIEKTNTQKLYVSINTKTEDFIFFLGERFHNVERAYFLQILFRFPLAGGILTSGYGSRKDPFTGHPDFHNGIDIAATIGAAVTPARDGIVIETGNNEILGNYIIIDHQVQYQTVYGHLSEVLVKIQQKVSYDTIIGRVGNTGRATGSHLHFEIRKQGESKDPCPLLPKKIE